MPQFLWIVIRVAFIVGGGIVAFLLFHAALCWISGKIKDFERGSSCDECCFYNEGKCTCRFWNWFPLSWMIQAFPKLSFLCPFCYDRITTSQEKATQKITGVYLRSLGWAILPVIGTFLGWVWALAKLIGGKHGF